jgi:N-methylhydantoinase A/oxoprolinase/acetone carboxylase beta subunit
MLTADVIFDYVQTIMRPGDIAYTQLETLIAPLAEQGHADVGAEGVPVKAITLEHLLDMRYQGQSYELSIPLTANFVDEFHTTHAHVYGYSEPSVPVEIVNLRLRALGRLARPRLPQSETGVQSALTAFDHRPVVLAAGLTTTPFYHGAQLQPGHRITGPVVITQPDTTVFIDSGDELRVDNYRNFVVDVRNS